MKELYLLNQTSHHVYNKKTKRNLSRLVVYLELNSKIIVVFIFSIIYIAMIVNNRIIDQTLAFFDSTTDLINKVLVQNYLLNF